MHVHEVWTAAVTTRYGAWSVAAASRRDVFVLLAAWVREQWDEDMEDLRQVRKYGHEIGRIPRTPPKEDRAAVARYFILMSDRYLEYGCNIEVHRVTFPK